MDTLRSRIEALGYEARPQITHDHVPADLIDNVAEWEKRFFTSGPNTRPTNIHVRRLGATNQRNALLFRDYLRAHPASAAAYGELKRRLAAEVIRMLKVPTTDRRPKGSEAVASPQLALLTFTTPCQIDGPAGGESEQRGMLSGCAAKS